MNDKKNFTFKLIILKIICVKRVNLHLTLKMDKKKNSEIKLSQDWIRKKMKLKKWKIWKKKT